MNKVLPIFTDNVWEQKNIPEQNQNAEENIFSFKQTDILRPSSMQDKLNTPGDS